MATHTFFGATLPSTTVRELAARPGVRARLGACAAGPGEGRAVLGGVVADEVARTQLGDEATCW